MIQVKRQQNKRLFSVMQFAKAYKKQAILRWKILSFT